MKPVGTYDEIANFSADTWWDRLNGPRRWPIDPGGVITVDVSGLEAPRVELALLALEFWSDVADIQFVLTETGADIVIDDEIQHPRAFYDGEGSAGVHLSASVNIWKNAYDSDNTFHGIAFFAFIHEIGHALGLGHTGPYDGPGVTYASNAIYENDSRQISVMSYFMQTDNPTVSASFARPLTPMIVDIIAIQSLYGAAPVTRPGDTVYGFDSNAGALAYDAESFPGVAYAITIYDTGGVDTLNYAGFDDNQHLDLNAEGISSVGGLIGNLVIARGVDIENAAGGGGDDKLIGNALANRLDTGAGDDFGSGGADDDTLIGAGGNDTLRGDAGADKVFGGFGRDRVDGGDGDDFVRSGPGNDTLLGGDGADTLGASNRSDLLRGGAGDDLLLGSNGADRLFGDQGADTLLGGNGRDTISGGVSSDRLVGGAGSDLLRGGSGDDTMIGGSGNDRIILDGSESGQDTILDFAAGSGSEDVIVLLGFGDAFDSFAEVQAAAVEAAGVTTVTFGPGSAVILPGVAVADLHPDDFAFG